MRGKIDRDAEEKNEGEAGEGDGNAGEGQRETRKEMCGKEK